MRAGLEVVVCEPPLRAGAGCFDGAALSAGSAGAASTAPIVAWSTRETAGAGAGAAGGTLSVVRGVLVAVPIANVTAKANTASTPTASARRRATPGRRRSPNSARASS